MPRSIRVPVTPGSALAGVDGAERGTLLAALLVHEPSNHTPDAAWQGMARYEMAGQANARARARAPTYHVEFPIPHDALVLAVRRPQLLRNIDWAAGVGPAELGFGVAL